MTPPDVAALLAQIRDRFHGIGDEELRRTLGKLNGLSEPQRLELQELTRRIVNKVLHPPSEWLREASSDPESLKFIHFIRKLFGLNR